MTPGIRPNQVPAAERPSLADLMMLAVAVVTVAGLYLAREVLVPIALAVLLSFVLAPLVGLLRRLWLGRMAAVVIAVLIALGVVLAIGAVIGAQVADVVQDLPRYHTTINEKIGAIRGATIDRLAAVAERLGSALEVRERAPSGGTAPAAPAPPAAPADPGAAPAAPPADAPAAGAPAPRAEPPPVPVEVRQPGGSLDLFGRIVSPVVNPLVTVFLIFVIAIFVMLQQEDLRDRMIRLFGSGDLHRTTAALDDAARRLSRYFLTQLGLNTGFGVAVGLGLYALGVPNPVLWGAAGALLRFVPYIGSLTAAALPALLAAAVEPGWSLMVWTAALMLAIELVLGQFVEPLVYGHNTGLSPVAVVISAVFWTWLWGPVGLILSTPLALCLAVLGRHIERLEFLDVLLGDRPALTPAESWYQRILAGDPDEAVEYAETLLRERALSAYYDEVAVGGLRMGAVDAARGVLGPLQIERMIEAVRELADQLDSYPDAVPARPRGETPGTAPPVALAAPSRAPPPGQAPPPDQRDGAWSSPTPVLCVAGRGVLDEGVALLLAQLLGKHGIGARVVPYAAASRAAIAGLDVAGVALVCVVSLEIERAPAHLRYLLRRLRYRLPDATLVAGLWPEDDPTLADDDLRRALNADRAVHSLAAAVAACVEAAAAAAAAPRAAERDRPVPAPAAATSA